MNDRERLSLDTTHELPQVHLLLAALVEARERTLRELESVRHPSHTWRSRVGQAS